MTIKRVTGLALVVIIGIVSLVYCQKKQQDNQIFEKSKPDVVFISIDTLRADRLGCYGYENIETPNIDKIAKKGILFSQVVSQIPVTLPSHTSIFTGLNPISHNVRENGTFCIDSSEVTLAEILKTHGYKTGAFIGGFPLDSRFGLDKGFDFYDDDLSQGYLFKIKGKKISWQGHRVSSFERRAEHVVKSAIKWLSSSKHENFFLFIHLFDPHAPYSPPKPFHEVYRNRPYDGEVAYVDKCIGKLFQGMSKLGILENAIVIITSDHGESLGEHNYVGHGKKLFEPSLRIPLLVSWSSFLTNGKVVDCMVRSVDILPTLLAILKIESVQTMQGVNLLPQLLGEELSELNLESYGETLLPKFRYGGEDVRSYRTGKWKYIRYSRNNRVLKESLFNLITDPKEIKDLSKVETTMTQELSDKLNEAIKRDRKLGTGKKTVYSMDEETKRKLKSLGYIR